MNIRLFLSGLAASAALCIMPGAARAQLFVTSIDDNTIGEYTTSGATVNPALISGLSFPQGIAVSGENLFVTSFGPNEQHRQDWRIHDVGSDGEPCANHGVGWAVWDRGL
jgi:hypothetical protein